MKNVSSGRCLLAICAVAVMVFQSCLKDTVTKKYTIYTPVYKSKAEVRAAIKSAEATVVQTPGKLVLFGKYIFLNELNKGIHIIDNMNPAAPVNKYYIDIPGNVDLAVSGNTLYADLYTDLVAIDISDPSAIVVKKIMPNVFPSRNYTNGFTGDTSRIITNWLAKDTTVDGDVPVYPPGIFLAFDASASASNNAAATIGINGSIARFAMLNNYLYTVTDDGLNVFNITQSNNPTLAGNVNVGWGIETIYPFKNNLFIGSQTGMSVYATTDPTKPAPLGNFSHARVCDPVIADGDYAYVTLHTASRCIGTTNELDIVDVHGLPVSMLVSSYALTNPQGLSKSGNTLFVCDGAAGLKIFDVSNPSNPTLLQAINGVNAYDVIATNNIAIVVGKDGLYEYDYSNTNSTRLISKISYN